MWYALAADTTAFWQNFSWWSVIDLVVFLALAIVIMIFFQRRNSIRLAIVAAAYMLLYVACNLANALIGNGFLAFTIHLLDFVNLFLLVCIVVIYQSDFKVLANKAARATKKNTI